MVRTQIQLPDELYARLKEVAEIREWSFAETLRRAGEAFVQMCPQKQPLQEPWKLPLVHLGKLLLPQEKWAEVLEDELVERHVR